MPINRTATLPVLPYKREGRSSVATMRSPSPDPQTRTGYALLEDALHETVSRAIRVNSWAVDHPNVGRCFEDIAEYLSRYEADDLGRRLDRICTSLLRGPIEALRSDETISVPLSSTACAVLDQLLSLLLVREPLLKNVVNITRKVLHRAVFSTELPAVDPELPIPLAGGLQAPLPDAALKAYASDMTFFAATRLLVDRGHQTYKRLDDALRCVHRQRKALSKTVKKWNRKILVKAFAAWCLQARLDRSARRYRTDVADRDERLSRAMSDVQRLKVELDLTQSQLETRCRLTEGDLHATQQSFNSFKDLADRYRKETEILTARLHALESGVISQLKAEVHGITRSLRQWKTNCAEFAFSPADNLFENCNRSRMEASFAGKEVTDQLLLQWGREMIRSFPLQSHCALGDHASPLAAASFILLLHAMSPGTVPYTTVERAFRSDRNIQADVFHYNTLSAQISGCEKELLRSGREGHYRILRMLFARFAGNQATASLMEPNDTDWRMWATHIPGFPKSPPFIRTTDPPETIEECNTQWQSRLRVWETWQFSAAQALGGSFTQPPSSPSSTLASAKRKVPQMSVQPARSPTNVANATVSRLKSLLLDNAVVARIENEILAPKMEALSALHNSHGPNGILEEAAQLLCANSGLSHTAVQKAFIESDEANTHSLPFGAFVEFVIRIAIVRRDSSNNAAQGDFVDGVKELIDTFLLKSPVPFGSPTRKRSPSVFVDQ